MGFLDPKERVMDIILTQYGRKKLSEGKLVVSFYRFFDDEVNYQTPVSDRSFIGAISNLLTENGEELLTEDGEALISE